jgi:hypothetical protein
MLNQLQLFQTRIKAVPQPDYKSLPSIKPGDEWDFMGMKVIGEGWQQERETSLKCRHMLGIKTKLRTQDCHLFEISNAEFSVALEFKTFPTYYGAIRAAIPTFIELGFLKKPSN